MTYRELAADQLDRATDPLKQIRRAIPRAGWIRSIRTALGMTAAQLGRRLGVTAQAVLDTEKRESTGDVTLTQLRKVADALDCELFYALVPRVSLATTVRERARKIATEEIEELSHSMALEDQQTDSAYKEKRVEAEIQRLLHERKRSNLWR
jgi:predicted DNA-binding mobile mystery protein A